MFPPNLIFSQIINYSKLPILFNDSLRISLCFICFIYLAGIILVSNVRTSICSSTQPIKKLKGHLKDYCLNEDGWHLIGDKTEYKLSELDEIENYEKTFYKDRWINEDGLEQHLVVTFSFQYRDYMRKIRNRQLERAEKLVENPSSLNKMSERSQAFYTSESLYL